MRVISETVEKSAGSGRNSVDNFPAGDHGAEGSITTGETLRSNQDVWLQVPMINGKIPPGPAHAGHDFIGDQEHAVAAADVGDGLQVSRRGNDCAERRSADRLEDECSRLSLAGLDRLFQLSRILLSAVAASIGAVEVTAIAVRHPDVLKLANHRQV